MNDKLANKTKQVAKKTKQGLYWSASLKIFFEVFRFGISIKIARILDPGDFGVMAIGTMVVFYVNSMTSFGFNTALIQKKVINKVQVNSVFTLNLGISIILTLVLLLMSSHIAGYFKIAESRKVLMVLSSVIILKTFYDIPMALLKREIDFKFISILKFARSITQSIMALVMALSGFKYWSLVWSYIIPQFLVAIVLLYKSEWRPCIEYNHKEMKTFYSFGLWNFIRAQLDFISNNTPKFFVAKYTNIMTLGAFEKANSLSRLVRKSFVPSISAVMLSSFSRVQEDRDKLGRWFMKILQVQVILVFPLIFGLYAIAPYFIIVLLGEKWKMSIIPLQILSIAGIFAMINGLLGSLNVAVGNYRQAAIRLGCGTVLLVSLCLFSVRWGVAGISYAYLLTTIVWFVLGLNLAKKGALVPLWTLFTNIAPYITANFLMVLIIKLLSYIIFKEISLNNMICLIIIGGILYLLCTLIINIIKGQNIFYPIRSGRASMNS